MSDIRLANDLSTGLLFYINMDEIDVPNLGYPIAIWNLDNDSLDELSNYDSSTIMMASSPWWQSASDGIFPTFSPSTGFELYSGGILLGVRRPTESIIEGGPYGPVKFYIPDTTRPFPNLIETEMNGYAAWTLTNWIRHDSSDNNMTEIWKAYIGDSLMTDPSSYVMWYSLRQNMNPGDIPEGWGEAPSSWNYWKLAFERVIRNFDYPPDNISYKVISSPDLEYGKWYFLSMTYDRPLLKINIFDASTYLHEFSLNTITDIVDAPSICDVGMGTFSQGLLEIGYSQGTPTRFPSTVYKTGHYIHKMRFYDYAVDPSTIQNIWSYDKDNKI